MYRVYGLSRDPFLPECDEALYYELPDRAEARRRAAEALKLGRPVWISGPPGSGRGAFLERLAEDLAAAGRSVLWAQALGDSTAGEFLADLLRVTAAEVEPQGPEVLSGPLYEQLLEAFARGGTVACFPSTEPLGEAAGSEARILSALRVAGTPVVALALCGSGEAPSPEAATISLSPFSPDQLRDCLLHRASACGAPEILSAGAAAELSRAASGVGDAVARARRRALGRLRTGAPVEEGSAPSSILNLEELDEVVRLLDSLAPSDESVPGGDAGRDGRPSRERF